jgi:hypothetical protein
MDQEAERYLKFELQKYDKETPKNPDQSVGDALLAKLYALC